MQMRSVVDVVTSLKADLKLPQGKGTLSHAVQAYTEKRMDARLFVRLLQEHIDWTDMCALTTDYVDVLGMLHVLAQEEDAIQYIRGDDPIEKWQPLSIMHYSARRVYAALLHKFANDYEFNDSESMFARSMQTRNVHPFEAEVWTRDGASLCAKMVDAATQKRYDEFVELRHAILRRFYHHDLLLLSFVAELFEARVWRRHEVVLDVDILASAVHSTHLRDACTFIVSRVPRERLFSSMERILHSGNYGIFLVAAATVVQHPMGAQFFINCIQNTSSANVYARVLVATTCSKEARATIVSTFCDTIYDAKCDEEEGAVIDFHQRVDDALLKLDALDIRHFRICGTRLVQYGAAQHARLDNASFKVLRTAVQRARAPAARVGVCDTEIIARGEARSRAAAAERIATERELSALKRADRARRQLEAATTPERDTFRVETGQRLRCHAHVDNTVERAKRTTAASEHMRLLALRTREQHERNVVLLAQEAIRAQHRETARAIMTAT